MKKYRQYISEEDKKREKIHEKIQKYYSNNAFRKVKENNELKSVEVNLVATFIKDEVSFLILM